MEKLKSDKTYRIAVISVCVGYLLIFTPILSLPDIITSLMLMIMFGLLGFGYKTVLIRNDLPDFFVIFGAFALVIFGISMIANMYELISLVLEGLFR